MLPPTDPDACLRECRRLSSELIALLNSGEKGSLTMAQMVKSGILLAVQFQTLDNWCSQEGDQLNLPRAWKTGRP